MYLDLNFFLVKLILIIDRAKFEILSPKNFSWRQKNKVYFPLRNEKSMKIFPDKGFLLFFWLYLLYRGDSNFRPILI